MEQANDLKKEKDAELSEMAEFVDELRLALVHNGALIKFKDWDL